MSYILDALRKSEERRKQNRDAHTALRTARIGKPSSREPTTRAGGLILTSCILLAVLILGAGWWWSYQSAIEPESPAEEAAAKTTPPPEHQPAEDTQTSGAAHQNSEASIKEPDVERQPVMQSGETPAAPAEEIVSLNELSDELQTRIADMTFSGHVYSPTPSLRMIMIDNVVVREGAAVAPDLTLVEITENGLFMQTGSTLFQLDLF